MRVGAGVVFGLVMAAVIGGLVGVKIESDRWHHASTAVSRRYTANLETLQHRLGLVQLNQGISYLSVSQLRALLRLDSADSAGEATAVGTGTYLAVRRTGKQLRAYLCDPSSLDPTAPAVGWSAWVVRDSGHLVSLHTPSDPTNVTPSWNQADTAAWAQACAVNKTP